MSDTVQDMFGGAMRKAFPEATDVQLWGSSIVFNLDDDTMTLRCAGKEVIVPISNGNDQA